MKAWDDFLCFLDEKFGKSTIDKWVRSLKVLRFDACNLYLEGRDSFQVVWYQEHIAPIAKKHLLDHNRNPLKVNLSCDERVEEDIIEEPRQTFDLKFESDSLLDYALLENFVITPKNKTSFTIFSKLMGFDPETKTNGQFYPEIFNPLYIYGPSGIGKTHLLMAAASKMRARGLEVFYVKAETFTDHVVHAIRNGQMGLFRQTYRKLDVLIVDDIEVFGRKSATQEEFFHTFNTLHTARKQIILSSSVNPRLLEYIEDRLVSRFEWGLTLPFEKEISNEMIYEIIRKRSDQDGLRMKRPVVDYLAKNFPTPAAVSRALDYISSKESITNHLIELQHVEPILYKLIEQDKKNSLNSDKILLSVAEVFGIKKEDILSKSQSRETSLPRQIAMYILRKELELPYMKIGDIFHRDHSTVMTSIKQITKGLQNQDPDITYYINQLTSVFSKFQS
jgi:chromosomal replication initiator protein